MTETPKRKKRQIAPPLRAWPPVSLQGEGAGDTSENIGSRTTGRNGLAGADDIVQWLALLMNKKEVSFDQLSHRSGVPSRTIKKWFSGDERTRTVPQLTSIQACFEALGQSMVVSSPSVGVGDGVTIYPIESFRQQVLEEWLEQSAKARNMTVAAFIEDLETKHQMAVENKIKGFRRRQF
ncbi:hypothetical protein [Sulfitobacter geojensis]|uniref:hypothetical protein n=1 Tax=Sulfitobacter geojensis TaxID=1342299 RepID=UPI003B8BAF4F